MKTRAYGGEESLSLRRRERERERERERKEEKHDTRESGRDKKKKVLKNYSTLLQ